MVGEVVRPQEVVDETVLAGEIEARWVFLEARESLALEVVAGQHFKLGPHPHVVLEIRLVHGTQHPGHPADPGLDGAEAQLRVPLGDAGRADVDQGLHSGRKRMHGVVDDGPALAAGGARVAACRDMEGDRQAHLVDAVPQGLHLAQVVVEVVDVWRSEDRLGGQAQALESQRCAPLDLGDRLVQRGRRNAGHRRQPVVVVGEFLPGPLVVGPAHRVAEVGIGRCPHGEALVREEDFGVATVQGQVAYP